MNSESKKIDYSFRHRMVSWFQDINVIGIRKIANLLPKLLIPKPKSELISMTRYGFWMKINPVKDNGVERSLYYSGTYEKGTLDVMIHLLREGDTFVDIGANIGLMSILAARAVKAKGKVISFEPNPVTRAILEENIRINDVTNIEVSSFAIGSATEKALIYDRWDANRGSASLIKPDMETDSYEIQVTPLSQYLPAGTRIDLIKIDVEGYELEALKGSKEILASPNAPMLIVECCEIRENTFGNNTQVLFDFIKSANKYRVFKSVAGKGRLSKLVEITHQKDLPTHDNIYCFTDQHFKTIPATLFRDPLN